MKIKTPKVIRTLDLEVYADELKGTKVYFWVNPPMEMVRRHVTLSQAATKASITGEKEEETKLALREWYAEVFSQGRDNAMSADELKEAEEEDSAFVSWLITRYWAERNGFIANTKKK